MNSDQAKPAQAIAAAAAGATSKDGEGPGKAGPKHQCDVLIVDDAAASRELLTAILRSFAGRLELREARNGTEGLAMWTELNPRITVLDIDMPDVDGLTVLQSLRQRRPDSFVAMISGGSSVDNVRKSLALGASGFVIKPYKPQRILDLLDKYTRTTGHSLVR
jgi:two-component system chemotaxis response regulator CheY